MDKTHIESFLSHLATQGQVSASAQKQALNAIIFLYRHVLDQPVDDRSQLAFLLLPIIARLPCFSQRFITRRMVSRLTLGQSCSTSAIPKGLLTF